MRCNAMLCGVMRVASWLEVQGEDRWSPAVKGGAGGAGLVGSGCPPSAVQLHGPQLPHFAGRAHQESCLHPSKQHAQVVPGWDCDKGKERGEERVHLFGSVNLPVAGECRDGPGACMGLLQAGTRRRNSEAGRPEGRNHVSTANEGSATSSSRGNERDSGSVEAIGADAAGAGKAAAVGMPLTHCRWVHCAGSDGPNHEAAARSCQGIAAGRQVGTQEPGQGGSEGGRS